MITAAISSKGQITIPIEIRNALKLGAGDKVTFEMAPTGGVIFKPAQKTAASALKGMLAKPAKPVSIEDMNAAIAKRGAAAGLGLGFGSGTAK